MKRSALLLLPALLGLACGEAETSSPTTTADDARVETAALSAVFSGTVVDNQGQPIVGARVTVNGIVRLTGSTGTYSVAVTESLAGYRFDIRKDGYAPVNTFTTGGAIAQKHVLAKSFTKLVDTAINNEIYDPASGIRVVLPANSLQTSTGTVATGRVSFFIAPHGPDTMPGDFSARNSANQLVALETVGAVTLAAVDANGNTLSLIAGKTLDVRLPVPAAVGGGTMPTCVLDGSCRAAMWRFDPRTGLWIEQAASAQFNTTGTSFRILGQRKETIDPADGLGTWNADIETVNPACTIIKFENIPLDCYNPPPATTPEPGLAVAFEQMTVSGTPKSKESTVLSSASFIALVNLRASTDLKLSLEFPPGAPAYCAGNLSITSTPAPTSGSGFPAYWATGGITQFTTGALTYTGYPKNSAGNAITLTDVDAGDHPCGSVVTFATHP